MNKKNMGKIIGMGLFCLSAQALAAPVTLTFDTDSTAPTYTEKGMTITATGDNTDVSVFSGIWGLYGSDASNAPAYSLTTGGLFDLISVDILHSDKGDPIVFNGYRNSVLVASETITADDYGFLGFTDFTGLDEVSVAVTGVFVDPDFDNLAYNASAVPVPASAWLFGSGLFGLASIINRRNAKRIAAVVR